MLCSYCDRTAMYRGLYNNTLYCDGCSKGATQPFEAPLGVGAQAPEDTAEAISRECDGIKTMLLTKNASYGDSAINPLRCFSKADAIEQLKVRIDDKLSRIQRGKDIGEDTVLDLIGYLVLFRIAAKT